MVEFPFADSEATQCTKRRILVSLPFIEDQVSLRPVFCVKPLYQGVKGRSILHGDGTKRHNVAEAKLADMTIGGFWNIGERPCRFRRDDDNQ